MKFTLKSKNKNLITQNALNYSEVNKDFFELALSETNRQNIKMDFVVLVNDSIQVENYSITPRQSSNKKVAAEATA